MRILIAGCMLVAVTTGALACDEATIDSVSSDGTIIVIDGTTYEVTRGNASGWSNGDTVQVCDGRVIDTDQNGESVSVVER